MITKRYTRFLVACALFAGTSLADASVKLPVTDGKTFLLTEDPADAPGVFQDALQALQAINDAAKTHRDVTLYVTPGVYWLDDPDDPEVRVNPRGNGEVPYAVELQCDSLTIIGLADDARDVVFAVNRGQTQGAMGNYTMIHYQGRAMRVENITFGNYCNVDLEYPRDPSRNRPKRKAAIVQAQIGWLDGADKLLARNCRFISRLNLVPLMGARRSLYKDCYFECTDDALTGTAVYQDCGFTFYSGKPLYSSPETGVVFLNCDIHSLTGGTQYFTKAPGAVTAIDTRFTSPGQVELKWTRDESPVRCYQSNTTLNGITTVIDCDRPQLWSSLDGTPLMDAYKVTLPDGEVIYNTPNLLGGDDGWDPLGQLPVVRGAEKVLGRKLTGLPVALLLNPDRKVVEASGDGFGVVASEQLWGGYDSHAADGLAYAWSSTDGLDLTPSARGAGAVSCNKHPKEVTAAVTAKSPKGLQGACAVKVAPYLREAPELVNKPVIVRDGSSLRVKYSLGGAGKDMSHIVWYRSVNRDMSECTPVRHGDGNEGQVYPLGAPDRETYIMARITPGFADSKQGDEVQTKPVRVPGKQLPSEEELLGTSFKEIPIVATEPGLPGHWHFDSYKPADTAIHNWEADGCPGWYYGTGVDAITGYGLVQSVRGARLSYTPVRAASDIMQVSLVAEPAKGPGQGFGSATGQYMDVCLKFEPVSQTGYGLRIERTPDYDKAVTFALVAYRNGQTEILTQPVPTSCFRNPCHISVDYDNGHLSAEAWTDAPSVTVTDTRIKDRVKIATKVPETEGTSLMVQHTGSTGASATLLRDLHVSWE